MIDQMSLKTSLACDLFSLALSAPCSASGITPHDFGYEMDEAEIADEMRAEPTAGLAGRSTPEVGADEFEAVYTWFLS
jgi:hypothetical protein